MDFSRVSQEEREKLYNEVWTDPVTTVAQRYDLSDNGLRKHLKRLWIPLPPSGYWAKVKAGQKTTRPSLPEVRGELKRYVHSYAIKFRSDIDRLTDEELKSSGDLSILTDDTISFIHEICSKLKVKSQLRNPHKLITEHKEESEYRRKRDKALDQARFNVNYYNITKSKYRVNKGILPIQVSDVNLNRAYRLLDAIINTIDEMEGYSSADISSGKDIACFVVMRTDFYFELNEEKNRKKRRSSEEEEAFPNLVLSMNAKNWFYRNIHYSLEYKDKDDEPLESQVGKIILEMFQTASKIHIEEILEEREYEREKKERERQQKLELMRLGELDEIKILDQAASDWEKAQRIRNFVDSMELIIGEVEGQEKREKLLKWLKWARAKADWLDPLTAKEDELLGTNKHIFDLILGTKVIENVFLTKCKRP